MDNFPLGGLISHIVTTHVSSLFGGSTTVPSTLDIVEHLEGGVCLCVLVVG